MSGQAASRYNGFMKCPKCDDKELSRFEHEGVEFDFCSAGCKGIWCDNGELAYYTETLKDLPSKRDIEAEGVATPYHCPRCETNTLLEISYLPDKGPQLEICSKCRGIWMDFKELGRVQELARHVDAEGKLHRGLQFLYDQLQRS